MLEYDWFDEDPEWLLDDSQLAFFATLRERARSWSCTPNHTEIAEPDGACDEWRAILDVTSEVPGDFLGLVTVGVSFDGTRINAGELHSQNYHFLPDDFSRVTPLVATGTPERLANIAADWFEGVMARPVVLRTWERGGRRWSEYVFADTGTAIAGRGFGDFNSPPDQVIHARGIPVD